MVAENTAPAAPARTSSTKAACGARRKTGGVCALPPVPGRTRCRYHGGKSLAGPAHPNWKHGMYDGTLPTGLAAHYQKARQNPELVKLTEQIALVDAKTYELLEQMARAESPGAWVRLETLTRELHESFVGFHRATQAKNTGAAMEQLRALEAGIAASMDLARTGVGASLHWKDITAQIGLRKALVDSEVKRANQAHEMVSRDKAVGMLGFIAHSIARHVTDLRQRQAVVNDIRTLLQPAPA